MPRGVVCGRMLLTKSAPPIRKSPTTLSTIPGSISGQSPVVSTIRSADRDWAARTTRSSTSSSFPRNTCTPRASAYAATASSAVPSAVATTISSSVRARRRRSIILPSIGSPSMGIRTLPGRRVALKRASTMQTILGVRIADAGSPIGDMLRPQVRVDVRQLRLRLDDLHDVEPAELVSPAEPFENLSRELQVLGIVDGPAHRVQVAVVRHRKQAEA